MNYHCDFLKYSDVVKLLKELEVSMMIDDVFLEIFYF